MHHRSKSKTSNPLCYALATVLAMGLAAGVGYAQEKKPPATCQVVEVISHASPGGGTDTTARMMMIRSRRHLSSAKYASDMVVVYKRGGGARKAHEYFNERPADGCTIMALTQTHMYEIARGQSPIKIDDIVGVARAMDDPTFIVVGKNSPYKTIEELIAASKQKPLNWGVAQIGSTEHIGLARLAKAAGMQFKAVAFGSGGEMVTALMANAIDATLPNVSEGKSQVEDGTFRALAVMSEKRLKDFPNVPSIYEKGYPIKVTTTRGYGVKKGTPKEVVDFLSENLTKAMKHKVFANYLKGSGLNPDDSVAGHEVWDKQLKEEFAIADEAIRKLGFGTK